MEGITLNRKKTLRKLNFTLIELMMAMAIFSLLALSMMGFFNSAQKIWSKSSQRGELYADAHVALDLIARELQCVMYSNEDTSQSFCPFWFEKVDNVSDPAIAPDGANKYYPTVNGSNIERTQLNFIAVTDLKPQWAKTNVCEVRYTFVPVGESIPATQSFDPSANNPKEIGEGWLIRSCTADTKFDSSGVNPKWNFNSFPRRTAAGALGSVDRVNDIWSDASSDGYQKIIPNVYSLKFTCYNMDNLGAWQDCKPMRYVSSGSYNFGTLAGTVAIGDGRIGTPLPMAVKIDLAMMSPTDWREWKAAVDRDDIPGAERIKRQRLRTFSKTVFINSKFSE